MSILLILYNTLYILLYIPALLVCLYKKNCTSSNQHCFQRLGIELPNEHALKQSFWFHAASVGEVRSLAGITKSLRQRYPEFSIVISTFTETGLATARDEINADVAFLLPVENRWALKGAVRRYNAKIFFITDTELWPNTIISISSLIPVFMLNGRISDKTFQNYTKLRFIFAPVLKCFSVIFARSEADAERFEAIIGEQAPAGRGQDYRETSHEVATESRSPEPQGGSTPPRIKGRIRSEDMTSERSQNIEEQAPAGRGQDSHINVGGNIKYSIAPAPAKIALDGKIALAASTHDPEEKIFISIYPKLREHFNRCIIVPRHIRRVPEIVAEITKNGLSAGLYSAKEFDRDILIVDAHGLLESFYQLSDRIFVGGSFSNTGGHNVFEALQYSKTVSVGPNTQNFNDIVPMGVEYGVIRIVNDINELENYFLGDAMNADFQAFFKALTTQQAQYTQKIEEQIIKCIGY